MSNLFASQQWIDELWAQLRSDDTVRAEGASWAHGPLLLVVEPDEKAGFGEQATLRLDLHEGEARDLRLADAATARLAPFAIAGSFTHWKQVLAGGGDIVDAVLKGSLRLRGDLTTLVRHRALLSAISGSASRVATSWQDEQEAAEAPAPAGAAR